MTTFDDSDRKFLFEEQIRSLLLKHIVDLDCTMAPREEVCSSHNASFVLALVGI